MKYGENSFVQVGEEFGANLRRARAERNLSQSEVAEKTGICRKTMYRYENGITTKVTRQHLNALSDYFGKDPINGDLNGKGIMEISNLEMRIQSLEMQLKKERENNRDLKGQLSSKNDVISKLQKEMYEMRKNGNFF